MSGARRIAERAVSEALALFPGRAGREETATRIRGALFEEAVRLHLVGVAEDALQGSPALQRPDRALMCGEDGRPLDAEGLRRARSELRGRIDAEDDPHARQDLFRRHDALSAALDLHCGLERGLEQLEGAPEGEGGRLPARAASEVVSRVVDRLLPELSADSGSPGIRGRVAGRIRGLLAEEIDRLKLLGLVGRVLQDGRTRTAASAGSMPRQHGEARMSLGQLRDRLARCGEPAGGDLDPEVRERERRRVRWIRSEIALREDLEEGLEWLPE